MKHGYQLLAVALVGLVVFSGFAAATGGIGVVDSVAAASGHGFGPGDGTGPANATAAERPRDGSHSPWVTGDDRLDRFQERFDLTDEQMAEIREAVQASMADGATRDEIRNTVIAMLEDFGVEDSQLGPPADGEREGPFGNGMGHHHGGGWGTAGPGNGHGGPGNGHGPHGPGDGSCNA